MEVKNSGQNTHIFITIGEIMLRLTPPNHEKIRMASTAQFREDPFGHKF